MKQRNIHTGLRIIAVGLLASISSACAIFTPTAKPLTGSEVCEKLNEVIADHANDFKQLKGSRKSSGRVRNMQIWSADRVFPLARDCQIWEWGSGLTSYTCSWQESGEVKAKVNHDKGADLVGQCLDEQWQSSYVDTQSGGGRTLFYQPGNKTVVSVRYFKESRTILENWKTTLYIGDESNLKAEVQ